MKLNWPYIAWRNLGLKKLQTSLSLVLLVAMSLATFGCGKRGPLSLPLSSPLSSPYDTGRMERG